MNDESKSSHRFLTLRAAFGLLTAYCVLFALSGFMLHELSPPGRILLVIMIAAIPPAAICALRWHWKEKVVLSLNLFFVAMIFVLPIIQATREPDTRSPLCNNYLMQTVLALHGYHEVHGQLPPAYIADEDGTPIHSWRVLVLPYMEIGGLLGSSKFSYDFSKPWDAPENLAFRNSFTPGPYAACPYCGANHKPDETMVVAVTGEGTAWPGTTSISFDDVTDGTDSTICLVSIANSGIAWTEPRDLQVGSFRIADVAKSSNQVSGDHGAGIYVARLDGGIEFLNATIEMDELQALCTINAGDVAGDEHFGQATEGSRFNEAAIPGIIMAMVVLFAVMLFSEELSQISHKHGTKISGTSPGP